MLDKFVVCHTDDEDDWDLGDLSEALGSTM